MSLFDDLYKKIILECRSRLVKEQVQPKISVDFQEKLDKDDPNLDDDNNEYDEDENAWSTLEHRDFETFDEFFDFVEETLGMTVEDLSWEIKGLGGDISADMDNPEEGYSRESLSTYFQSENGPGSYIVWEYEGEQRISFSI